MRPLEELQTAGLVGFPIDAYDILHNKSYWDESKVAGFCHTNIRSIRNLTANGFLHLEPGISIPLYRADYLETDLWRLHYRYQEFLNYEDTKKYLRINESQMSYLLSEKFDFFWWSSRYNIYVPSIRAQETWASWRNDYDRITPTGYMSRNDAQKYLGMTPGELWQLYRTYRVHGKVRTKYIGPHPFLNISDVMRYKKQRDLRKMDYVEVDVLDGL